MSPVAKYSNLPGAKNENAPVCRTLLNHPIKAQVASSSRRREENLNSPFRARQSSHLGFIRT